VTTAADQRRGRLFVAAAALAWSTAGLLQRELTTDTATQLAGRALFAFLGILAYVAVKERGHVVRAFRAIGRWGLAFTALTAVSSGTFIIALNHTSVANVLFVLAVAPVLSAALGTLIGEQVPARTWVAIGIAVGGVALMVGGPDRPNALGASVALLCAVSFAVTLVIARHRREVSMAPATCLSQLLVFVCAAPFASPSQVDGKDLALLIGLGVGQIGLGLVLFTIGARLIPAAEVGLITLLEIVLGPLWVWLSRGERPGATTLAGGAIVLGAVVFQVATTPQLEPVAPPP
jgi:drug/metabolite transporter (DMT)-like permease